MLESSCGSTLQLPESFPASIYNFTRTLALFDQVCEYRRSGSPLILQRPLDMIDDEDFDWAFCGFQLQTKLVLDCREDRKP